MKMKKVIPLKGQTLELYTSRLYLRQITREDAQTIVELRSHPESYRFFRAPHLLTLAEHMRWYEDCYCFDENRVDWIALCREKPIGLFGVHRTFRNADVAEISYLLSPSAQGCGYAAEAVEALMQWMAREWRIKKVFAEIHKKNTASIRFIQKMGFQWAKQNGDFCRYEKRLTFMITITPPPPIINVLEPFFIAVSGIPSCNAARGHAA